MGPYQPAFCRRSQRGPLLARRRRRGLRPLQPVDPAVVSALQKILIDRQKGDPAGGAEEAEPKAEGSKPAPRR